MNKFANTIVSLLQTTNSILTDPSNTNGAFSSKVGSNYSISFSIANWVIIGVYLFAILCIGIYFSIETKFKKKTIETSQDYFVASKSIPGWAIGFSLFATSLSAITFLSIPSQIFGGDWITVVGGIIAPAFAPFLIKYIVPFFRKLNAESGYDYIHKRYGVHLRLFISITFILFQTMRAAVVVYLPTIAISTILPQINQYLIASIVIIITIIYSYLGGLKSVIYADLIQGFILTIGILVMIFWSMGLINNYSDLGTSSSGAVTSGSGGFAQSAQTAFNDGKFLANGHWSVTLLGLGIPLVFMSFFVNAIYPLVGGQDVVQRYQASKTKRDANKGIMLNAYLNVFVGILMFYGFGTLMYQLFSSSNQLAYNVLPFQYTYDNNAYNISTIWVAHDTIGTYQTNIFGYSSKGWIPLMDNNQIPSFINQTDWKNVSLQDIKNISIMSSSAKGDGALVSVNSIVSNFKDFNKSNGVVSNSNLVPYFIATVLPVGISGLIIAAILAAGQSTMSSCFNAASSCFVNDILKLYYPNLTDKQKLVIGKIAVIAIGLLTLLFTMLLISTRQDKIFLFFNSIAGLFGASTLAIFFIGMFGNYVRNNAGVFGIWIGIIVAIITFLLSYDPAMKLFGQKVMINGSWVSVFSFISTYVACYLYQYLEDVIKHSRNITLVSYQELTNLGKKLNANNEKIIKWSKFGMHHLLAKKCIFENLNKENFNYKKIQNGNWTLTKFGTNLINKNKISEKTIIWLNRFGLSLFIVGGDSPKNDNEYWERMKNITLKDISSNEKIIDIGEDSWNWDVAAYQSYVRSIYKNKVRSSDLIKLEEKQMSFEEFQDKSSYNRYLLHTKFANMFKFKKYKSKILSSIELKNAQKMFLERE